MSASPLPVVRTVAALRAQVAAWKAAGERVALVPTMGALHDGHLSLIRLGNARADRTVASVFVNPTQFAPHEDFDSYPRGEGRDAELLASAGCALMFAPTVTEMYPDGFASAVSVTGGVAGPLEGQSRPHFFGGVATVVTKLLNQCQPHVAIFGEKDYQQLAVIRRFVKDLDMPVEIVGGPTDREADDLARSSRNAYLTPEERARASALPAAMKAAVEALRGGEAVEAVEAGAISALKSAGFAKVDYVETRDGESLERLGPGIVGTGARVFVAAWMGRTRLIDNWAV
ncbi:pantoate--beta-alanine ligase [Caulobacter mirabilis]|uniref:Pantothenate synthetase n=1 Tax=Caulobacter mirabilis TaxID=69666 RepID=A0A2D2AXC4_9CAUL|nr:pantoate--beta-alanine ligase [Caulobacter mirabilis]ATQ42633.1 pantoate--beta-alanine ligase [Caulobacter mirabilis]